MPSKSPFLLYFFLLSLIAQIGYGPVCASCPSAALEDPACHEEGPRPATDALRDPCCCASLEAASPPEFPPPLAAFADEPVKQTLGLLASATLSTASATLRRETRPLGDQALRRPPLYLLHCSQLI